MTEYYDLPGTALIEPAELSLERTQQLYQAVMQDPDCNFVECRRSADNGWEVIVVDLQADGVSTRCRVNINYEERVAFVVPQTQGRLVNAWMLRKDFPALMHQNQTLIGTPRDLCLYFEPTATVMRSWTAQRFIRRVKWWLASSATQNLHAADQPPEALFFNSRDELVVPHDFDTLVEEGRKFELIRCEEHTGGGNTYVLSQVAASTSEAAEPIQITLPPIVHGIIEDTPSTIGDFAGLLTRRGADLLGLVREQIAGRLSEKGATLPTGGLYTILITRTPMQRSANEAPSAIHNRAFIIFEPFLEVGRRVGALFTHNGRYFRANLLAGQVAETHGLDDLEIFQLALLRKNSINDFRNQSGSPDEGVKGVLIGAGALGSSLANLWARAGWGTWTIIDKDHVKPHNLTRHVALDWQIGAAKATVASALAVAATGDITRFRAIKADALATGNTELEAALTEACLVIDASTTLEYPRIASDKPKPARHMSVFVTPSGNSSVILAETADRSITLRTVESQYYRALIDNPWGQTHLAGNWGTFWSGASCRDISFKLSLAQVQGHAANLAQMVMRFAKADDARIAVWHRDTETGAVNAYTIPTYKESMYAIGDFSVYIDEGIEAELRAMRIACLPNETGGILLGYHDLSLKTIIIVKACPAPIDSVGTPISFVRGTYDVAEAVKSSAARTANIVGYVGEWHTHPRGHTANASRDDVVQLVGLTLSMVEDGLPALQLIVGESDINILIGQSS